MVKVITAPESINVQGVIRVFLGGAIDMGDAVNWQQEVIDALSYRDDIVLFNPRRAVFTPDTLDEQIRWELIALHNSHCVIMWFPANAKAPVAMLETGLMIPTGALVIGAEPGFYRRRNLEMTCEYYGITLHDSLKSLIAAL